MTPQTQYTLAAGGDLPEDLLLLLLAVEGILHKWREVLSDEMKLSVCLEELNEEASNNYSSGDNPISSIPRSHCVSVCGGVDEGFSPCVCTAQNRG